MVKIITTNSYYNFFEILNKRLENSPKNLGEHNFVFCEEKISLMTERKIASHFNGSFNTFVYSFGNYYALNKREREVVTKEGASMIVRKILSSISLKAFKGVGQNLAPKIFELIIQLKSASITPNDLENASKEVRGILKNKLIDISAIYSSYENYLKEHNIIDQSAQLDFLPEIIENDEKMKGASVFIVGYIGFTAQIKNAIKSLIKTAKDVTFILPDGENKFAFVGETALSAIRICENLGEKYELNSENSDYNQETQYIVNNLFAPLKRPKEKIKTDKIYLSSAFSNEEQARKVAGIIRNLVLTEGARYRDFTVVSTHAGLKDALKEEFIFSEIPFAIDDRKTADHHPLVRLIVSYIEIFRKNKERKAMLDFIKNPLVTDDKEFCDIFENYLYKYNVNYSQFSKPFTFEIETELGQEIEAFRKKINELLTRFNPELLLEKLSIKEKLENFSSALKSLNALETSAVNEQIYKYITRILGEIKTIFGENIENLKEYKEIFLSAISALKISILPQVTDAVFVGDFKECAMAKAKYLFLVGLDESIPNLKSDVAILTDKDLDALGGVKVLIEPKIKIVNQRAKEQTLLGTACFSDRLYAIYSIASSVGAKGSNCEIVNFLLENFTTLKCDENYKYSSFKSGLRDFAIHCSDFAYGREIEMGDASCFYELNKELCEKIVNYSNKEVVIRLDGDKNLLLSKVASPTAIEEYYSCPYKFFVSRALRVKERDEGVVNALSVGNLMHEIFASVIKRIDDITGEEQIYELIEKATEEVVKNTAYSKLLLDPKSQYELKETILESHEYLKKMYRLHKNSLFKSGAGGMEVVFGKNGDYPEIPLLSGKVSLSGKIDRVDTYGDYFRVIDYKTGKVDASEKGLYSGTKLQLYLYGLAIKNKKLAGAYYMPIKSGFLKEKGALLVGKTLNEVEIITAQDKNAYTSSEEVTLDLKKLSSEKDLTALVEYSKIISEKAVLLMEEGFIFPTPYEDTCTYCEYKAFCANRERKSRKVKAVKEKDFSAMLDTEAKDE